MLSTLLLLATSAALAASAAFVAATVRVRGMTAVCLAVYVIAYAELVTLIALLSAAHAVTRGFIVLGVAVLLGASSLVWVSTGRRELPSFDAGAVLRDLRDPPLAFLAVAVALAFGYLAALALFTPPNSGDALWYHLPRAAFWKQQRAVGYIANPNTARLNGDPPVGEIGLMYTMVVAGIDRYVTTVALAAYVATSAAVFGLARRIGAPRVAAMTAGLLFATLPLAALQASTALNDLVVASFFAVSVYFWLGETTADGIVAALALALALGTKLDAVVLLPLAALIVVVARRRRSRRFVVAAAATVALGSAWFVLNAVKTGSLLGGLGSLADADLTRGSTGIAVVAMAVRHLIGFLEVPGAAGWWLLAYALSAALVAGMLIRTRTRGVVLLACGLIVAAPFLVVLLQPPASRAYEFALFHLGHPALGLLDHGRGRFAATPMSTYYGPLGLVILATVIWLRRPLIGVALAAAPLLFAIALGPTVGFGPLNGRFFAGTMALALAAFATALVHRQVRWAAVAVAVPTLALTLRANAEKPPSIWGKTRTEIQTHRAPNNGEARVIRYFDKVPPHANVGLLLGPTDLSYPFFGAKLQRHVVFVRSGTPLLAGIEWLVLAPDKPLPPGRWRLVLRTGDGFRLYRGAAGSPREAARRPRPPATRQAL